MSKFVRIDEVKSLLDTVIESLRRKTFRVGSGISAAWKPYLQETKELREIVNSNLPKDEYVVYRKHFLVDDH